MNALYAIAIFCWLGGITGYLLNVWCPVEPAKENWLQVVVFAVLWPFLLLVLFCMWLWIKYHPEPKAPPPKEKP